MNAHRFAAAALCLGLLACSSSQAATPTSAPTATATETEIPDTATPEPTSTKLPTPTPTPNPGQADIEELAAAGRLTLTGHFIEVQPDFTINEARRNFWIWYQIEEAGALQNFAIGADISWQTASDISDWWNTGCGFFVRPRDDEGTGGYFVAQTADGLPWLLWARPGSQFLVDLLRPASYDYLARASVGEETGSQHIVAILQDRTLRFLVNGEEAIYRESIDDRAGVVGAVVVSGTNKTYGTRCEFSNLWIYALDE